MLVIFPFEQEYFRKLDIDAKFVGHPLVRNLPTTVEIRSRRDFLESLGLKPEQPVIGIFPGSRRMEINYILPVSLKAIERLAQQRPDLQFIISSANDVLGEKIQSLIATSKVSELLGKRVVIVPSAQNKELMAHCDFAWAKSGTTTLELTICKKPMLIYYKGSLFDYYLFCLLKTTKLVGLPNILSQQEIIPELLQYDCNPGFIARVTTEVLGNKSIYNNMVERLSAVRNGLAELDYVSECVQEITRNL